MTPLGRPIAYADNYNNQIDWTLDALGDPVAKTIFAPNGTSAFYRTATFDGLGRQLTDASTATGKSWSYTYDKNGNALTAGDPLGHVTTRVFDALNRLTAITDANNGVTRFTYDTHDRPLTVTDPNGNVTAYTYSGFGDRVQQISPDSGTTIYRYDGDGNLLSKTDSAGVVTNHSYDRLDRILTTAFPASASENVAYSYDQTGHGFGIGRLTSLTDAAGGLSRSYDERGNLLSETRVTKEPTPRTFSTAYRYDKASRIASITYPSGAMSSYTRDNAGNVTAMPFSAVSADAAYSVFNATHEPFGPVNYIYWNSGDRTTFTFDKDYRLNHLAANFYPGTASFVNQTYTFDAADNVLGIKDGVTAANSQSFGYDALNRLVAASSAGTYGNFSYAYDKNGNLLTQNTASYAYASGTNRLNKITTGSTYQTVSYTATGSINAIAPSSGTATSMLFNNDGRLASVTTPSQKASYTYDAFGHRIFKALAGSPNSVYLYGQDGTLQEEVNNGVATDYLYLDGVNVANWQPEQHHLYFITTDRLGTPLVSRDEYGLTNWAAFYQPYGTRTVTVGSGQFTGPVTQSKVFPGQEFDTTSGFHQNGFREYAPSLGRYMEVDPIGVAGGLNGYLYVGANPIRDIDPAGTEERPPFPGLPSGVALPKLPGVTGGEETSGPSGLPITPKVDESGGDGGSSRKICPDL